MPFSSGDSLCKSKVNLNVIVGGRKDNDVPS